MRRRRSYTRFTETAPILGEERYCARHGQKYDPNKFSMCYLCFKEKCCNVAGCTKFAKYLITAPNDHWHQKLCEEHKKGRTHMGLEAL